MTDGDLESLVAEYVELTQDDAPRFSLEEFCGGHAEQLAFARDRSQWIHAMCARQSGKTYGDDGILLDNGFAAPRSTNLFLGLVGTGIRISNWFPVWRPLCDRYGVPERAHNETTMTTTFPNSARAMFAGTDDLTNVKKYLGNRLDNSVVIIDEAQDQPPDILHYLLNVLLPPMLTPTSRVILSGVLADLPVGEFLDLSAFDPLSRTGGKGKGYSHHEWGRAANVHTPEAMAQLKIYMALHGIDINDPQIQRDWFMRRVWDLKATAYRYDDIRNGYDHLEPEWLDDELSAEAFPYSHRTKDDGDGRYGVMADDARGCTEFSCAIDPGTTDRFPVEVLGWGPSSRDVRQVFEWTPPRKANMTWGDIGPVLGLIRRRYDPAFWYYDAQGSNVEMNAFASDYDVPAIMAARKTDAAGQLRRNNDLLQLGRFKAMRGSALVEDYQKARRDMKAQATGQVKFTSQWHPDPSEAARYALQGYYDSYVEPEPELTLDQRVRAERDARRARTQDDKDAEDLGMPPPEEVLDLAQMWDDE